MQLFIALSLLALASANPVVRPPSGITCSNVRCGGAKPVCVQPRKTDWPMCVARVYCGGLAGEPCPDEANQECVDYPANDCTTARGDKDCQGICVPRLMRIQS